MQMQTYLCKVGFLAALRLGEVCIEMNHAQEIDAERWRQTAQQTNNFNNLLPYN